MRSKWKLELFCIISLYGLSTTQAILPACHPLDPLSAGEIEQTVQIINSQFPPLQSSQGTWAFYWITLKEPLKSILLPYFQQDQDPPCSSHEIPRRAFVQLVEKEQNIVTEVIVNLLYSTIESMKALPRGTQQTFTPQEGDLADAIVKADPRVLERCRQMGWTNMSLVITGDWSVNSREDNPELKNAIRPVIVFFYGALFEGDNHLAHPFDFAAYVDLATQKVLSIENLPTHADFDVDNRIGNECPKTPANFNPAYLPSNFLRTDLHPIEFVQKDGPSYTIRGNEVSWQKFKIRIGFNAREGPIIHQVSYQDGSERRPLFYRMSVAEFFVPYGDPRPPYHQKFIFDEGEFTLTKNLPDHKESGVCRGGVVTYMDILLHDEQGNIITKPNAFCIFEEDAGLLWAHKGRNKRVIHTRSQRLTISVMASMSNYDYQFSWHFYQDASIEFKTELHGVLTAQLIAENVTDLEGLGTPVFPQINGQYHQHFISVRLDPELDGNVNTVSTVEVAVLPDPTGSPRNPYGQGWTTIEKLLKTQAEARTNIDPLKGREWLIRNQGRIHPYTNKPVAWKLVPHSGPPMLIKKDSPLHHRCAFTDYTLWVTKYEEGQLYPAGFYANVSGLPEWVAEKPDEDLTEADTVIWYTLGVAHVPRVEDFPVMPIHPVSIRLIPANFFMGNPGVDVAPPPPLSS